MGGFLPVARVALRALVPAAALVMAGPAGAASLAEQGKAIAEAQCARCHVVDPERKFTSIESTPSFHLLVTAFPDWKERFETFYSRRPHPSVIRFEGVTPPTEDQPATVPMQLRLEDVDAIVAYAESLKAAADHAK